MHVTPEFIETAITSQGLNNLSLWNAGKTSKLLFHTGTAGECINKFRDALEWIEGSFVVEAWADSARSAKGRRPTTAGEKCTWMVKGRAGQVAPAASRTMPADGGTDARLLALLEKMDARLSTVETAINGVDDDEPDEPEQLPEWMEEAAKKGIGLVERLADHFIFKGATPPAAPAAQHITGTATGPVPASAEWMELNRALKRLERSDPAQFATYKGMLLQVYGDAAAAKAQQSTTDAKA